MTLSWCFYDAFMTLSWCFHYAFMMLSWCIHDAFMMLSWCFHDAFMTLSWHFLEAFMRLSWRFMMLYDTSWRFMTLHDPCCNTFDDVMIEILMFWGFDDWLTDSLTNGRTTLVVKSLSRLKIIFLGIKVHIWSIINFDFDLYRSRIDPHGSMVQELYLISKFQALLWIWESIWNCLASFSLCYEVK